MNNMNDYREARKKEILDIMLSNPNQALLLLRFLPKKDLIPILEAIFKKHIVGRFGTTATNELVYKTMDLAYGAWTIDYNIEKRANKEKEEVKDEKRTGE